jgi:hypothetical protein
MPAACSAFRWARLPVRSRHTVAASIHKGQGSLAIVTIGREQCAARLWHQKDLRTLARQAATCARNESLRLLA